MGIYLIADSTGIISQAIGLLYLILKVALGIGFVIFVHELGHFLAAKLCGVKCEKFYVGFDVPPWSIFGLRMPTRIARFRWGETEYGIGILPLGGYVKMLGQEDNPMAMTDDKTGMDPRNYQAQTVPERMFIISAGIIMNVISAALMAAIAFRAGVAYSTSDFHGALAGSAAWKANVQPGDRVVQIGKNGKPTDYVRYKDLRETVIFAGLSSDTPKPVDFLIEDTSGNRRWVSLAPRQLNKDSAPTLGVLIASSNTLAKQSKMLTHLAASRAKPKLQEGDRVIAVNGQRLDDSRKNDEGVLLAWQLSSLLSESADKPLRLRIVRTDEKKKTREFDAVVPPQPMRWLGFTVRVGPVTAIREGSPAEKAGLEVGDIVTGINGVSIGDPITLPVRFAQLGQRELTLNAWRKNKQTGKYQLREFVVTPESTKINGAGLGPDLALEGIGLSYAVRDVVWKTASGSRAAKSLQPGDRIKSMTAVATNKKVAEQIHDEVGKGFFKPMEVEGNTNWILVHEMLQGLPKGVELQLKIQRGKKERTVQLGPYELAGQYDSGRGLAFKEFRRQFKAATWGDAMRLGVTEAKSGLLQVAGVLKLLFTGRVSPDNLGGPIMIATLAGQEAKESVPRLLIFLTFLSTNLALINALPIPVLDGGHFLFLTIELVRRRPVPVEWQQRLSVVGLSALILLMVFVFFNDILRFTS